MNEPASNGNDFDTMVAFVRALESAVGREEEDKILTTFCSKHPTLTSRFRETLNLQRLFAIAAEQHDMAEEPIPNQLGDFHIKRKLPSGGMGDLFEAVQEAFGRRVIVKTIRADLRHVSKDASERFLREQRVLARLHHTHIVPIYAAGFHAPLHYYAMAYIDGAPLSAVVRSLSDSTHETHSNSTPSLADLIAIAAEGPKISAQRGPDLLPRPIKLSTCYYRSVAKVMADAADAVDAAHRVGIRHRDIKPSNLMVNRVEHCYVIDFGLADDPDGMLMGSGMALLLTPGTETSVTGAVGTPQYMAPEQFGIHPDDTIDHHADIWSLGATLYEILTLTRAFDGRSSNEIRDKVLHEEPVTPGKLVKGLPRDLQAICLKALRKPPLERYPTAKAFAEDLRRWRNQEPTSVWRTPRRRVALWSRRNKGWAITIVGASIALTSMGLISGELQADRARANEARVQAEADAARNAKYAAIEREQTQLRESLIQETQRIRLTPHSVGWSDKAWDLIRRATAIQTDRRLQSEAILCLEGLDAHEEKAIVRPRNGPRFEPSSVVFDPKGQRWLVAVPGTGVLSWNGIDQKTRPFKPFEDSTRFAVRNDGIVLALVNVHEKRGEIVGLRAFEVREVVTDNEVDTDRLVRRFEVAGPENAKVAAYALASEGTHLAVVTIPPENGPQQLRVWEVGSGRLIREVAIDVRQPTTDVTLSPDGRLVALADSHGHVTVWPLPEGEPITNLSAGRVAISVLQFGRNPVVHEGLSDEDPTGRWLLAAGDVGGSVIVWDLHHRNVRSLGHGSNFDVKALTFSPDGATLASAGRVGPRIWDIASGRVPLEFNIPTGMTALAFSPDGKRLALTTSNHAGGPGGLSIWRLDNDRGVRTLRGLQGQTIATDMVLSSDGKWLAVLEHGWHAAVWERNTGFLKRVFETPIGLFADNAHMAFSPDGKQLSFATSGKAVLWDIETGKCLRDWDLPPSLGDRLAFLGPDRLLLCRYETQDGKILPVPAVNHAQHPRVCRIRNLLGPDPLKPLAELTDFDFHLKCSYVMPDGSAFVLVGQSRQGVNGIQVATIAYESTTGRTLWSIPSGGSDPDFEPTLRFAPTGVFLALCNERGQPWQLLALPYRTSLGRSIRNVYALGPGANRWVTRERLSDDVKGFWRLWEPDRTEPVLEFEFEEGPSLFAREGRSLILGRADGTTSVLDLVDIQGRLTTVGLGW
jgi:serine/threonine protein kinase/WD40 repeat protein